MNKIRSSDDIVKAAILFRTFLDVPAPDPEEHNNPLLRSARELALISLVAISSFSFVTLVDTKSPEYIIYEDMWPNILDWARYFCCVVSNLSPVAEYPSGPQPVQSGLPCMQIFNMLGCLIVRIKNHFHALFKSSILNDGLLDLIVKIWLRTKDQDLCSAPHLGFDYPQFNAVWLVHLHDGLKIVHDGIAVHNARGMVEATEMILREAGGDASMVTDRLVRHLKHPAKADKRRAWHFDYVILVIHHLCDGGLTSVQPEGYNQTKFMDVFLKDDIVRLTIRLLSFVIVDISRPRHLQIMKEEGKQLDLIQGSLLLLHGCEQSRNGMHWAMVMLKLGLLRIVASLAAFPMYLRGNSIPALEVMLSKDLPGYFCYRFVVVAAIRAVKEITIDGTDKNLQSGLLQGAWETFEDILLDRAVFNAIYERDYIEEDCRQCFAVRLVCCDRPYIFL